MPPTDVAAIEHRVPGKAPVYWLGLRALWAMSISAPAGQSAIAPVVRAHGGRVAPDVSSESTHKNGGEESANALPDASSESTGKAVLKAALLEVATAFPAALAVGAALVYGLLSLAYSEFYSELGVRPSEVGLQYGPGIGGIAGVTIVLIGVLVSSLLLFVIGRRAFAGLAHNKLTRGRSPVFFLTISFLVLLVCILFAVLFARAANSRADKVKGGEPVEPMRFIGIEILAVRADLVNVEPTDLNPSSVLDYLRGRHKLFYLGRNGGTLVLYDDKRQTSWHVPASALAMRVANCETRLAKVPACPD